MYEVDQPPNTAYESFLPPDLAGNNEGLAPDSNAHPGLGEEGTELTLERLEGSFREFSGWPEDVTAG
jgi:hypothetical protein